MRLLHEVMQDIGRGDRTGFVGALLQAALSEMRVATVHGAHALAEAVRLRPHLLEKPLQALDQRNDEVRALRLIVCRLSAAWSGDDHAAAWLRALIPPSPRRGRAADKSKRAGKRGLATRFDEHEIVAAHNAIVSYVREVHSAARAALDRPLVSPRDRDR